jgi:DNA-binding NtrC family response regulator
VAAKAHLLIVDDEANTLASLSRAFRLAGHEATVCDSATKALELARAQQFDLIFSDVVMPVKDGLSLLEELKAHGVTAPVVMMSGQAHIEMAVRATRLGAIDFLEKPISTDKLLLTVENALRLQRLESENQQLRQRLGKHEIVWQGETMRRVMAQVDRVAASETRVCILGETGTGKELIARAIYEHSRRSRRPFIRVNCAAIPPSLIASELFGHEKGAFTGAVQRRLGRFESANGGTIFLDEIGELPMETQITLLRVLQERELERVGSSHPISIDVRIIAATNRDLTAAVAAGTFRQDLFYRLNVFPIQMPALRERAEDIPLLVEYLVERYARKAGKRVRGLAKGTIETLQAYAWPGNIRELQNVIERAVILCEDETVSVSESWLKRESPRLPGMTAPLTATLADREKEVIEAALAESRGRISGPSGAAVKLGIPRQTLDSKIANLQISKGRFKVPSLS